MVWGQAEPFAAIFALFGPPERRFSRFQADSALCREPLSHQEQVAECEEREQWRPVLRQTSVVGFHVAELALEDLERMRDLGPHIRDDPVDPFVELIQFIALRGFAHDSPEGVTLSRQGGLPTGMDIALDRPDGCFHTVQNLVSDLDVVGLNGGRLQAVDDAAVGIHAHMSLHAEVPVVAFLC